MKATINGLRYDTDAAKLIGRAAVSRPGSPHYWDAALYRSPRADRYFLAGEGGMMTLFKNRAIVPLTNREALQWIETYLKKRLKGA